MKRSQAILALLCLVFLVLPGPTAAAAAALDDEQTHRITVTYTTRLRNAGTEPARSVKVHVPLLSAGDSRHQRIVSEELTPVPASIAGGDIRIATFAFDELLPAQEAEVVQRYELVLTAAKTIDLSLDAAPAVELHRYLDDEAGIESTHAEITALVDALGPAATFEDLVEAILTTVRARITYDPESPARNQGALTGLRHGSGVCTEFAALFAAVSRAAGVPARLVNGRLLAPAGTLGTRHQWVEVRHPRAGWLPVDPTFGVTWQEASPFLSRYAENYGDAPVRITFHGGQLEAERIVEIRAAPQQAGRPQVPASPLSLGRYLTPERGS